MKKIFDFVLVLIISFGAFILGIFCSQDYCSKNLYTTIATVSSIDYNDDIVTFEDTSGNLWDWSGVSNLHNGDTVALCMNTHGTDAINDDSIVIISQH